MAQRERLSHALLAHLQSLTTDGHVTGESAESLAGNCKLQYNACLSP